MKKRGLLIFSLMFAVLLISLAVGDFDDKNREVIKFYSTGEIIKGTINISFDEEPANSLLTSNFKGNITLLEFLEKNYYEGGVDFECSTAYCLDSFTAGSKTTQVNVDEDKFVGFKLVGDNVRKISSVKMDIASNIETSCFKQLDVDIGNDGENVLTNNKYVDSACFEKDYGCFDLGLSEYNTAIIPDTPLCEKITLNPAPAYKVGAKVQNSSNIEGEIEMELRDFEDSFVAWKKRQKLIGIDLSEDEDENKFYFMQTEVFHDSDDIGEILTVVMGLTGVSVEDLTSVRDSFPSEVESEPRTGEGNSAGSAEDTGEEMGIL